MYVSSYCYVCVLILLYVSSYCYVCVLILLYAGITPHLSANCNELIIKIGGEPRLRYSLYLLYRYKSTCCTGTKVLAVQVQKYKY